MDKEALIETGESKKQVSWHPQQERILKIGVKLVVRIDFYMIKHLINMIDVICALVCQLLYLVH